MTTEDKPEYEQTDHSLIISFPDQSASFVHGYESGILDEKMNNGDSTEIEQCVHSENLEVITRMAQAYHWDFQIVEKAPDGLEEWTYIKLTKNESGPRLRVVK